MSGLPFFGFFHFFQSLQGFYCLSGLPHFVSFYYLSFVNPDTYKAPLHSSNLTFSLSPNRHLLKRKDGGRIRRCSGLSKRQELHLRLG